MAIWKYPPQLQYQFGYENHKVSSHATPSIQNVIRLNCTYFPQHAVAALHCLLLCD